MRVRIPTPLRSYTAQQSWVDATGSSVAAVLADLDARYPGLRFRVIDEQGRLRRHMNVYVNQHRTRDLSTALHPEDELTIMQALSGG